VKRFVLAVTEEVCPGGRSFWRHEPLCQDLRKTYRITGLKFISTTLGTGKIIRYALAVDEVRTSQILRIC
jgi:hypothetical protein